ncbi:DUF1614 domain-containing protein [Acidianus sp. RZ1]|uniref:DUF1614 domain-containing protein n=1 Tax=Acidianus sp. RZ1 TaxID=1540082 RepID=UPI00149246EE|nr:DUF1614 domain-containing protein [Acidianus sp. RZ1]NON62903.1 DUF1614 domain-containing protein [Acidianus sp. RZ1]
MLFPVYVLLGLILLFISMGYFRDVLSFVGVNSKFSYLLAFEVSVLSLSLSPVNLVVKEVKRIAKIPSYDVVYVFGIPFYIPRLSHTYATTLIALNFGGAIMPLILSLTLMYFTFHYIVLILFATLFLIIISKILSKVIEGVGVVMHPIVPPLFAVLISYILFMGKPELIPVSAYISSVLGTLIGADLLNLRKILDSSPQIVSIGGMGSFDGIFLSGLFSIVIGEILISLL